MLDERKRRVLHALTDDYIETAEPVGSRNLARKHQLGVSPATVRNEMADLEEAGYLQQPHTSAGRVPSDKGYRYYVDELIDEWVPGRADGLAARREAQETRRAMEELIHDAARLLASATKYTSLVASPKLDASVFRHIELVPLDDTAVLAVFVSDPGFVQHRIIEVKQPVGDEQAARVARELNRRLFGIRMGDIGRDLLLVVEQALERDDLFEAVADLLVEGLGDRSADKVYLEGTLNILNQPEFRDIERARALLALLEAQEALERVLNVATRSHGTQVLIGQENPVAELRDCSVVVAAYTLGGEVIGAIGVLGPTRMEYAKAMGMVQYMADHLSESLLALMRRR